jgi:hypothetical protein
VTQLSQQFYCHNRVKANLKERRTVDVKPSVVTETAEFHSAVLLTMSAIAGNRGVDFKNCKILLSPSKKE